MLSPEAQSFKDQEKVRQFKQFVEKKYYVFGYLLQDGITWASYRVVNNVQATRFEELEHATIFTHDAAMNIQKAHKLYADDIFIVTENTEEAAWEAIAQRDMARRMYRLTN